MENKMYYALGQKDMLASILAETKDKIKLSDHAKLYPSTYKEEHFSHQWHVS